MTTLQRSSHAKPKSWEDGATVPTASLPDGTIAEAMAALGYAWDGSQFVKLNIESITGGLKVYVAGQAAGGGSAVSISDGADVAQGAVADAAWSGVGSGTVISLLKKIASAGGSAVSVADGADVAQGTTTDLSSANTVVGILKAIKAAITGTLTTTTSWAVAQHVIVDTAPPTAVTGPLTDVQLRASAVPVSAATLTDGTQRGSMKMLDSAGTNVGTVKAASTAVAATDTSLSVGLHPSSPLPAGTAVIGALSANQSVNHAQVAGAAAVASVTGVQDVMPRKRTAATGLSPVYSASHITTATTTTVTAATAYVSSILVVVISGTSPTLTIKNKEATAKQLGAAVAAAGDKQYNFTEPILMTSGIDLISGGTSPVIDVFITYWQ